MKWFNNLKVGKKVLIASSLFMFFIIGVASTAYFSLNYANENLELFYTHRFESMSNMNQMIRNNMKNKIEVSQAVDAARRGDDKEIKRLLDISRDIEDKNGRFWKKFSSMKMEPKERKLADECEAILSKLNDIKKSLNNAATEKDLAALAALEKDWQEESSLLNDKLDELIAFQNADAHDIMVRIRKDSKQSNIRFMVAFVVATIIGIIITFVLRRSVSGPVKKGLAFAKKIAIGNFTERIDMDQRDELGELAKALNESADNLEMLAANVTSGAQNLSQAVEQIASGNEDLSQRTSEQASALEEIASAVEETAATINLNADNAQKAYELALVSSKLAEEGGRLVYDAVGAINEISHSSKKIADIITMINEISFQTNLLALNAAVEAARAGDQGKGFAVVAGEVRNLAQRSGNASKEIGLLIKESLDKIDIGTEMANRSGKALKEIISSVNNVKEILSEIAAASQEQRSGIGQINIAVTEMDSMTQENSALVEETASASEQMANQAQELLSQVKKFKTSRDDGAGLNFKAESRNMHKISGAQLNLSGNIHAAKPAGKKYIEGSPKTSLKERLAIEGFEEF